MGRVGFKKGGWINRLWFYVAKRTGDDYVEVYNQSVSGGTTNTILERLKIEASVRGADALIFQTGGNDASYEKTPGNYLVPLDKFRTNLEEIIKLAKTITPNIIFMDLKNCDESKTMPVSWIDIYYTNENIQKYLEVMKIVCRENNVLYLDLDYLTPHDFDDGLHPNSSRHEKIFLQAKNFLTEHGWI